MNTLRINLEIKKLLDYLQLAYNESCHFIDVVMTPDSSNKLRIIEIKDKLMNGCLAVRMYKACYFMGTDYVIIKITKNLPILITILEANLILKMAVDCRPFRNFKSRGGGGSFLMIFNFETYMYSILCKSENLTIVPLQHF